MVLLEFVLLILTFYLLAVVCDEFFVDSLDKISERLKLSHEVAGATLMAVGSSAPEFFTSLIAVFTIGNESVGAGTIVGSAIFNILVIIGVSAMFKKAKLTWQPVIRDLLFYALSIMVLLLTFRDGKIVFNEAVMFVALYAIYIFAVTQWSKWLKYEPNSTDIIEEVTEAMDKNRVNQFVIDVLGKIIPKNYIMAFFMSILLIGGLSFIMVESAVSIAHTLNINKAIIALTILAAGTSIPDLLSSIIVAKKGRGDMAISNSVGSNIFDILFGLGFPWLLVGAMGKEVIVSTENLMGSIFLLFATILAVLFILIMKKWKIGKRSGAFLVFVYVLYLVWNVYQVIGL